MKRTAICVRWLAAAAVTFCLAAGRPSRAATPPAATPPQVEKLKSPFLATPIVQEGEPVACIVVANSGPYRDLAQRIARAVKASAGVTLPIVTDDAPAARLPLAGHVIAVGNRSTNRLIETLYNRFYTLLDLRYPGRGGYVVRTLCNPFGNGLNVILAGGSDWSGTEKAVDVLAAKLREAGTGRSMRLDRLAEIRLGDNVHPPEDLEEFEIWEASAGYGSVGYFGWNILSKRMAMYYMTGDPVHAREFLRLAFPDARTQQEISRIDGERIEDKEHPLSGPYHYAAHMMVLFWDLIEESPVFSDQDRLRITRALAAQLDHLAGEWVYAARSGKPPRAVGSRHGQWAAISLYCLARYFETHYPDPVWERCLAASQLHFRSLHDYAWVSGENDNLFWYNTAIAPALSYLLLTGDRVPVENGVLATLLRGQEILISGRSPDWALKSASIGYLQKAAYLTGDDRWLAYRDRTGVDTRTFRLGQSYWPQADRTPKLPRDLANRWTMHRLPKPKWESRQSGLPWDRSFEFASFRSRGDEQGDFILIDGLNGGARNPYHTFALLELRLDGSTLLEGFLNQVFTRVDGLMEPHIAMDAAVVDSGVLGATAYVVAEVPHAAFSHWQRSLVCRAGRHLLVVDELTFESPSPNAEVYLEWETARSVKHAADGQIFFRAERQDGESSSEVAGQVIACDPLETSAVKRRATMRWSGPVTAGGRRTFFSLVGLGPNVDEPAIECHRTRADAAALGLPGPAVVVVHSEGEIRAELAVAAADHLFARAGTQVGSLFQASRPVDLDWDLTAGILQIDADHQCRVQLDLDPTARPTIGDRPLPVEAGDGAGELARFEIPAGRHTIRGAIPRSAPVARLRDDLESQLAEGRTARAAAQAGRGRVDETFRQRAGKTSVPVLKAAAAVQFGSPVVDLQIVHGDDGPLAAVAEGPNVHLLTLDGETQQSMTADGPVRMLAWWPEPKLLLAGCADEKVIAFDVRGSRRWVFVSQMDPAVVKAGKTYWYKSAPGHEGIHGLATGPWLDGGTQAFVGSACTLEILDSNGTLLHRMPQFWGKVSTFAIADAPDGTKNLLAARKYNGSNTVAMINNRTLDPAPRSFIYVPPEHTYVPGWSCMNRFHLFCDDLDGDGSPEVAGEINGTWNRVCVWNVDGRPLWAANFGPGPRIPARTMLDLDVSDLDGDSKKEIVATTSYRQVVALDCHCNKLWATRLPAPAAVLACVRPNGQTEAYVVLGCDDGQVRVLDARGTLVRTGSVAGRAMAIERLADRDGNQFVAIGTEAGGVSLFLVPE